MTDIYYSVYVDRLHQQVVADLAEESMMAVICVKASPHYAEVRVATYVI